jgi:uncharacterized membrane protein
MLLSSVGVVELPVPSRVSPSAPALPVLLIFSSSQIGFLDIVNGELVAKEVVAMLVGSIGLIAAVPITTAIAGRLSVAIPPDELAEDAHGHAH